MDILYTNTYQHRSSHLKSTVAFLAPPNASSKFAPAVKNGGFFIINIHVQMEYLCTDILYKNCIDSKLFSSASSKQVLYESKGCQYIKIGIVE